MIVCQRPKRASSISTLATDDDDNKLSLSVNALNGLLPFLHNPYSRRIMTNLCVNALNGLLPFLRQNQRW